MFLQGCSILWIVFFNGFIQWVFGAALLGARKTVVYPTLQVAVSDCGEPQWRASALGVYRFWRGFGYAAGALISGILADTLGIPSSMKIVGLLAIGSSVIVTLILRETLMKK